jgi:hypothetical protein
LLGQLLSSGIVVRRKGEDVALTEMFAKHLEGTWLPFVRRAFDELMVAGYVVVSIEAEGPAPFDGLAAPPTKRTRPNASQKVDGVKIEKIDNLVPEVAEPGSFQLSFVLGGRVGYKRIYTTTSLSPGNSYGIDPSLGVFFRNQPDSHGNPCSPVATCFDSASFVAALQELALQAEVTRARTQLITQAAPKVAGGNAPLSAAELFFDSETRQMHAADQEEGAAEQAAALGLISKMCAKINSLQTRGEDGSGMARGLPMHAPPEVPPRLFTIPDRQVLAPPTRPPEARTDLEALLRQANDAVCAAFGVPASVIFEGARFCSN